MLQKKVDELTLGEAHLYLAIAKADGHISQGEYARGPYYAQKSQDLFNIMKVNDKLKRDIKSTVRFLMQDSSFSKWDANNHLDEAERLLKKAKNDGNWGASLAIYKNEDGLYKVAILDGYILKESQFLLMMKKRLKNLL